MTTSMAFRTLKATLDNIITDKTDNVEKNVDCNKYMTVESMSDHYEDDLENGGPGLLSERDEGQALEVGTLYEGAVTRYISRKFGKILELTDELEEDGKYNGRYINFARRLKRAGWKTVDVDCANLLNRASNSAYVGGDGQPLASATHTIPGGGTYSNTLATPMSPSKTALQTVIQNAMLLPGHDGLTEGYDPRAVLHPISQWAAWKGILNSEKTPDSGNNEINVVYGMGIKQIPVRFWTASTTNWAVLTDAPDGLKLKWRRRFVSRTWVEERTEVISHKVSGRWARGWSNPRAIYFVNA
jgi:hypothetical protein